MLTTPRRRNLAVLKSARRRLKPPSSEEHCDDEPKIPDMEWRPEHRAVEPFEHLNLAIDNNSNVSNSPKSPTFGYQTTSPLQPFAPPLISMYQPRTPLSISRNYSPSSHDYTIASYFREEIERQAFAPLEPFAPTTPVMSPVTVEPATAFNDVILTRQRIVDASPFTDNQPQPETPTFPKTAQPITSSESSAGIPSPDTIKLPAVAIAEKASDNSRHEIDTDDGIKPLTRLRRNQTKRDLSPVLVKLPDVENVCGTNFRLSDRKKVAPRREDQSLDTEPLDASSQVTSDLVCGIITPAPNSYESGNAESEELSTSENIKFGHDDEVVERPAKYIKKTRQQSAVYWYREFNRRVFGKALPSQCEIVWNPRLRKTAGQAVFLRFNKESTSHNEDLAMENEPELTPRTLETQKNYELKRIELSPSILTTEEKMATTLLHECCHLAQRLLESSEDAQHGPLFRSWARKASRVFPEFRVSVKHHYELPEQPHRWECKLCKFVYSRQTKSIDPKKHRCGNKECGGPLIYLGSFKPDGTARNLKERSLTAYQSFIKENYSVALKDCDGCRKQVMKTLAMRWKQQQCVLPCGNEDIEFPGSPSSVIGKSVKRVDE